jgi:hypothetical protein
VIHAQRDLVALLREQGLHDGQEQFDICVSAISHLGKEYKQNEEIEASSIDCSTLTSQAHWIGAQIGIPFIAEGQRTASSGETIDGYDHAEPGDVVICFPSVSASPDGKHNHVGIFLGRDGKGQGYVIEARGGKGVVVTPEDQFLCKGGIRRFWTSKDAVAQEKVLAARRLAAVVPKLGRLGAKQYLMDGSRLAHKGQDIYSAAGTAVVSPAGGKLRFAEHVTLECPKWSIEFRGMSPVAESEEIQEGGLLGFVDRYPWDAQIRHSGVGGVLSHLDVRLYGEDSEVQSSEIEGANYYNYLRAVRLGRLQPAI